MILRFRSRLRASARGIARSTAWRSVLGAAALMGSMAVARADETSPASAAPDLSEFSMHEQTTLVEQFHPSFRSPYRGAQSLDPGARGDETFDLTAYLGARLWRGAELWVDPEVDQGFGLSSTLGVDAFTSAEAYKVGHSYPYVKVQRLLLRQTIDLGGERQPVEGDVNQFARSQTTDHLVLSAGKLSVVDIFDTNRYASNARSDFMNWALINTATFDYAADAWGYTYGGAAEWYVGPWTVRGGAFDLSGLPNNKNLDKHFHQYELTGELEHRHTLWGQPGAVRVTGFVNRGRMAAYQDAILVGEGEDMGPDLAASRHYHSRPGISFNAEQAFTDGLGVFVRGGHSEGKYEGYEFTDISTTIAAGLALDGGLWGRKGDTAGLAGVVDRASNDALRYFAVGGLGILAGDGQLPHPGREEIIETYYSLPATSHGHVSVDYQFVNNPAFNRDRGPVSVFGLRLHAQL